MNSLLAISAACYAFNSAFFRHKYDKSRFLFILDSIACPALLIIALVEVLK